MSYFIKTDTCIYEVLSEDDNGWTVKGRRDKENVYKKSKRGVCLLAQAESLPELFDAIVIDMDSGEYLPKVYQIEDPGVPEFLGKTYANVASVLGACWFKKPDGSLKLDSVAEWGGKEYVLL